MAATFDFFGAQANARRRTTQLVVSFTLALLLVVLVIYGALLLASGPATSAYDYAHTYPYSMRVASEIQLFQPRLLLLTAIGVVVVVGLGTVYHAARLSAGGGDAVAQLLGGTLIDRSTRDPAERRLVNVLEEMSVAAGIPVPRLYVLRGEESINAFASGYTSGHSVVAVTRGALEQLDRDELQGVVAHELSHLLNADTRIDLRLMAAVGGLTVVAMIGRVILNNTRSSRRGNGLFMIGLALLVAGGLGVLCGKLVRYAVARQREWLADASAVQFTRNPNGLAGALRKIARAGSVVRSPYAPEASHLFFANGVQSFFSGLFSTHPPIEERIGRIMAGWPGKEASRPAVARGTAPAAVAGGPLEGGLAAGLAAASPTFATRPAPEHVARAARVIEGFPPALTEAVREPFGSRAVIYSLLLDDTPAVREQQLARFGSDLRLRAEVERLGPSVASVARTDRMALLGLALPAMDALSPTQSEEVAADLRSLITADGTVTFYEWALRRVVLRRLARGRGAPPRVRIHSLDQALPECLELLSWLCWAGGHDANAAGAALDAAVQALGIRGQWRPLARERLKLSGLDSVLTRLDMASLKVKSEILGACVAAVIADQHVTVEEAEVVRVISASLGLAVPPVIAGSPVR